MKINKITKLTTIGFVTFIIVFSFLLGVGSLISHLKAGKVSHANYSTQDISVDLKTDIINNEKEFTIDTAEDMYNFAYWYSNLKNEGGFDKSNVYFRVKLTNNIDMSTVKDSSGNTLSYYPIKDFYGEFDGQGHIISNLTMQNDSSFVVGNLGLFASIKGKKDKYCVISDLTLENITINVISGNFAGSIAGQISYANINKCNVKDTRYQKVSKSTTAYNFNSITYYYLVENYGAFSGLIGASYNSNIEQCINELSIITDSEVISNETISYIGGIVAISDDNTTIKKCRNTGMINASNKNKNAISNTLYVGGITAYTCTNFVIDECMNQGHIYGYGKNETYIGGIVGCSNSDNSSIKNCLNLGQVSGDCDGEIEDKCEVSITGTQGIPNGIKHNYHVDYVGLYAHYNNSLYSKNPSSVISVKEKKIYMGGIVGSTEGEIVTSYNNGEVYTNKTFKQYHIIQSIPATFVHLCLEVNGAEIHNLTFSYELTLYSFPGYINNIYGKNYNSNLEWGSIQEKENNLNSCFTSIGKIKYSKLSEVEAYISFLGKSDTNNSKLDVNYEKNYYGSDGGIYVRHLFYVTINLNSNGLVNSIIHTAKNHLGIGLMTATNEGSNDFVSKTIRYYNANVADNLVNDNTLLNLGNRWYQANNGELYLKEFSWIHSVID